MQWKALVQVKHDFQFPSHLLWRIIPFRYSKVENGGASNTNIEPQRVDLL